MALQELSRRKPLLANRTPPEVETLIVELSLELPASGQVRSPTSCASAAIRCRPLACAGSGNATILKP